MSNRLYVGTRKGLFTLARASASEAGWSISKPAFLGDRVPMVLPDPRDGFVYAALSLDHFGAKLHRSADGNEWEEVSAPAYPHMPEEPRGAESQNGETPPPSVEMIWSLEAGGSNDPGACGREPSRAGCSDPGIAEIPGIWSGHYGIGPNATNGSEADTITLEFIRYPWTRGTAGTSRSGFPAAEFG